jgi:transcriptional regulator with XRE-family HTH domain
VTEQPALSFAGLLRRLRAEAKLTQEELAAAAGVSPRSVSNLERGINRTAHKDTAVLLAGALGLTGPAEELFVAAARGNVPAAEVLAVAAGARPRPGAVIGSPYRGLAVFEEQDAGWFFGREAVAAEVLSRMSRLLAGTGLLVVSAASGAGKSSLLRAGVLPRIRAAGLAAAPAAASWPYRVLTPTQAPLDELALWVAVLAGTDASAVRRGLEADPAGYALPARQAALARPPGSAGNWDDPAVEGGQPSLQRRLLLVVDQFEELFTQCADERQRRAFITALYAAATAGHGPDQAPAALVALGVRADFEARCADYPELAGPVQDRYLVTAMTERQLRIAITEPAKKAGSRVDDDLTGRRGQAAARLRPASRPLKLCGDLLIRTRRRLSTVPGAAVRVDLRVGRLRQRTIHVLSLQSRRRLVRRRADQRRRADSPASRSGADPGRLRPMVQRALSPAVPAHRRR